MRSVLRPLSLCLALAGAIVAPAVSAREICGGLSLVLLIGQSNMSGRGAIELQDTVPIPGVFALDAGGHWVPAVDPLHWDSPKTTGVGLGREFSRALVNARPGTRIGLIPAAVGGTSLERWRPGGDLYLQALERLRGARKCGRLVAILWHQGESDANHADAAATYAVRWAALMTHLRADAGASDVPIIAGELGDFLTRPFTQMVTEQLHTLPKRLDHVAIAPARGLTDKGDRTHFDAASQRELGRSYAGAFFTLVPTWKSSVSKPKG